MCSCLFIEMNQTAHISLQIPIMSNSTQRQKPTGCANLPSASRSAITSDLVPNQQLSVAADPPQPRLSAAGEGGSKVSAENLQEVFFEKSIFFEKHGFCCVFIGLREFDCANGFRIERLLPHRRMPHPHI